MVRTLDAHGQKMKVTVGGGGGAQSSREGPEELEPGVLARRPTPSDSGTFREGEGLHSRKSLNISLTNYFKATSIDLL